MTGFLKTRVAAAAALLLCGVEGAAAGPMPQPVIPSAAASGVVPAQFYGYGYPPYGYRRPYGYYRPYGGFYRPYGYGPGPRFYGPGAAKERFTTRRQYCRNQPQRC